MIYCGLALASAWCAGILAADKLSLLPFYWFGAMACFTGLALASRHNQRVLCLCLVILAFCAGGGRLQLAQNNYAALPSYVTGHTLSMQGTVEEKGSTYDSSKGRVTRYVLSLDEFTYDGEQQTRSGKGALYVTIPAEPVWECGTTLQIPVTINPVTYYRNEGMYDAKHRDQQKGIIGTAYCQEGKKPVVVMEPSRWQRFCNQLRSRMTRAYERVLGTEQAYILSSLVFGGHYEELPPSLLQSFSATGLIHILSVSGSHVSLLLGIVQMVGQGLRLRGRTLFVVSAVLVISYAALAEFTAPVVRSAIMGLISAYSLVAKRDYTSFHALALAVLAMTLQSPFLLFDLSFRLSCGAAAGIVLLQPQVKRLLFFLPRFLQDGLAVCICAQLLLFPLLIYYFHAFPLYSFLANLTVGPILDITIILGLAAAVADFFFPPLAAILLYVTSPLLATAVKGNYFIAALPGCRLWLGALAKGTIAAYYLFVGAVFCGQRWRRELVVISTAVFLLSSGYIWLTRPETTVYIPDVGNDRATCAIYSDRTIKMWYNKSQWANPEQVACVLTPALQHQGIFRLDEVYVGGYEKKRTAEQIVAQFSTGTIMFAEDPGQLQPVVTVQPPYYMVDELAGKTLPAQACLEIRSLHKRGRTPFPKDSSVLILQRGRQHDDNWQDWAEEADYYGIPWFSTYQGGEIIGQQRKGFWHFSYCGGDIS